MTTREYIYELRCCQALAGSGKKVQESFDAAIAALEKQAEQEQPKRLAPFPWKRGIGSCRNGIYDASGDCVVRLPHESHSSRDDEVSAHILAHSQAEPDAKVEPTSDAVDPAAVRVVKSWCNCNECQSENATLPKHISRTLDLPEIRYIGRRMSESNDPAMSNEGYRILRCLDGKEVSK